MGDGTRENPYTREDVLKAIEENGGTAKGLDLSGKTFEEDINLFGLDLSGIILRGTVFPASKKFQSLISDIKNKIPHKKIASLIGTSLAEVNLQEADLSNARLNGINMRHAQLQKANLSFAQLIGTNLWCAQLQGANLEYANLNDAYVWGANLRDADISNAKLRGTHLRSANMEGVYLFESQFSHADLRYVNWGNYISGEEKAKHFRMAAANYRELKLLYNSMGFYDVAGEFFFREMTVRRKTLKWWPNPIPRAWSKFISLICGYGERPLRVIAWAASVVLGSAFIYFIIGSVWEWWAFWKSLYFSAVSFTALGYGSGLEITNDWIKGIGAFESFVGVFTMALFLITFIRKMTR